MGSRVVKAVRGLVVGPGSRRRSLTRSGRCSSDIMRKRFMFVVIDQFLCIFGFVINST